jgi:hypothetical protein
VSAIKDLAETLIDRLPYADGNGRRRMLAGGVLLLGILIPNWSSLSETFTLDPLQILRSPLLIGFVALAVYLAGSVLELFGTLFLVRAAAGLLTAFDVFGTPRGTTSRFRRLLAILATPVRAMWGVLWGFLGFGSVNLRLEASLSCKAHEVVSRFPSKVILGLENPVGDYGPLAEFYLLREIKSTSTRKWARRQLTRVADIAVSTTAVIAAVVPSYAAALKNIPQSNAPAQYWEAMTKFTGTATRLFNNQPRLDRLLTDLDISRFDDRASGVLTPIGDVMDARDRGQYVRYLRVQELNSFLELLRTTRNDLVAKAVPGIELERPALERQRLEKPFADSIGDESSRNGLALTAMNKLDELIRATDEFSLAAAGVETYHRQVTTVAIIGGIGIFMLLLYRGFFMSSRNAILSIIETLAMEASEAAPTEVRMLRSEAALVLKPVELAAKTD